MQAHTLCRSCHMKETYKNPDLVAKALKKRRETCMEKYGQDNVAKVQECQEKEKATRLERYGYEKPFLNKVFQEQVQIQAHTPSAELKRQETSLKKHGAKHHMKSNRIKDKLKVTYKEKTGYDNPMHNPEVKDKIIEVYGKIGAVLGYVYKEIHFDSSWELAYYIWLVDNNKKFIYHPPFIIDYLGNDKKMHKYCPDFLVEGKFYEIKGTQFFNENNEPYNMYTKQFWWEKFEILKTNNISILKKEDITPYLKYISDKYGKGFLKQFKMKKK